MVSTLKYSVPLFLMLFTMMNACKENQPAPPRPETVQPTTSNGQEKRRSLNMDISPMDISYFPDDFPVLKMSGKVSGTPVVRIIYSRPSKDGREIFGNVVKYGTYWRLGANEGTEIEFFRDVIIKGKKVKKGRYIIYSVPYKNKWTIKLNEDLFTWGLSIHSARDVYSFDVPVITSDNLYEFLTMKFEPAPDGAQLMIAWDSVRTYLPFKY